MDSKIVEELTTRLEKIEAAIKFQRLVAEYGAPAVLTGDESDGIDVSAYGFSVPGSSGVLAELDGLTGQVKAMEAKVGVHLSQVSLLDNDDMGAHHAPHYVPSMTLDPPISAVTCSFEPVTESFVELAQACEHLSID
ncbi:hypothetical protein CYMTET_47823 [Cymbomonas tetramitiformis]|uniref:Uncharacterized protein n=1 Tax=Cymbomonas tetramitiformis TaxID=36881 RepID=A0AAE0BUZ4_9CHLO|nr:hypothetical protein CYMTET_47823 [Cymbomonas tetramitiformis]